MATLKEKLAALDRPVRQITVPSRNGESEVEAYYIRPTQVQDQILQKQLTEEYDTVLKGLKTASDETTKSVFERLVDHFMEADIEVAVNYVVRNDLPRIREEVIREAALEPLTPLAEDATDEEKEQYKQDETEFMEVFKPAFDERLEKVRARLKEEGHEALAKRAALSEVESRATRRAIEIHRRNLVAESIFDKDGDKYVKAFESADDVANNLPGDTIITLATKISEELEKVRQLPLNSVAKT